VSRDPRIDAYIARAQPFARPILERVRERIHAVVPDIEEAMKWSHPNYLKDGKIVLGAAAFKEHASVHFWRGQELGMEAKGGAMGQLGRLASVDDLPPDLDDLIRKAAELSTSERTPRTPKHQPKPAPEMHPEFAAALAKSPKAKAALEAFAPEVEREYLEWIADAKREETRQKRIATAVEWLSEGKKRNWQYESC
jgi:uncharacterized protein YdeI (YjbR/CyaY-like superfamily)